MVKKTLMILFIATLSLSLFISCNNENKLPEQEGNIVYESATKSVQKEIYSLYKLSENLKECYTESEDLKATTLFCDNELLEIVGALYGENDALGSDLYFEENGKKHYLYSEEVESIYDLDTYSFKDKENQTSLDVKIDDPLKTIVLKNLEFDADFTEPKKSLNVKIDATLKTLYGEDHKVVSYDLDLIFNGKVYPHFHFENTENGYLFTYEGSSYIHTHVFSPWKRLSEPQEDIEGRDIRECSCGYFETRIIPKLNAREITVTCALEKTYDGKEIDILNSIEFLGDGTATIEYKEKDASDDKYSTEGPKDAGEYTIRISVPASGEYTTLSTKEVDYTISKIKLADENTPITGIFKDEVKTYNGNTQTWEAKVSNSETRGFTAFSSIIDGETLTIRVTTNKSDASGTDKNMYLFNYNYLNWASPGGFIEVLDNDNQPLHNYELSICNENVTIEPIELKGTLTGEKTYDGRALFAFNDLSSLTGVLDCDKSLIIEASQSNDPNAGVKTIDSIAFYTNEGRTINYTIEPSQIHATIKRRPLAITEYGTTLKTPYLDGLDRRIITLGARNGTDNGKEIELSIIRKPWNDNEVIDVANLTDSEISINTNYYFDKSSLKTIEVKTVNAPLDDYIGSVPIKENSFIDCYFELQEGEEINLAFSSDKLESIVPYICDSNGRHYYSRSLDDVNNTITYSKSGKSYLFIYAREQLYFQLSKAIK